ncbi:MAG TPA: hypothetical protein VFJ58_06350 [Armatimonadota bacterium]|nr:hypothetical protein [Armatimonadota bacterium]
MKGAFARRPGEPMREYRGGMSVTHTFSISTRIPDDRRVEILLPPDVPAGDAELVVVVVPKGARHGSTGQDLLHSEIFGMWADRTDISDSVEFAAELRGRAWRRT